MAAPAQNTTTTTSSSGPINDRDVEDWKNRFNEILAKPADVINSRSPAGASSWTSSFFGCFNPIDLCAITCCLPCITFGKTHHRVRKDVSMQGYEPINTSCLLFWGSSCCGLHWIPIAMQRADIRAKYNLEGNCITDLVTACCCGCCDLIQQEKESEAREPLSSGGKQQYQAQGGMTYPTTQ